MILSTSQILNYLDILWFSYYLIVILIYSLTKIEIESYLYRLIIYSIKYLQQLNQMQFVQDLQNGYQPEIICLVAQTIITGACILRIRDCLDQFPIRQLGPASSIICVLSFYIANIINLIGKAYVKENGIHDICIVKTNNFMFSLAILYNIARELPFVLFTIKTLRVSLCFWPRFNKINVEDIYKWFVAVMKSQTYFTFFALCYVCLANLLVFVVEGRQQRTVMIYQYFCKKDFSIIESVVSGVRVITLCFVLYLSIWTYQELDFKKFLMTIFIVSNLSALPHILNLLEGVSNENDRWPIYYVSYIVQLLNSLMMLYYNGVEKELNQPAMQGVLQSWKAFHNLKLGMDILFNYAAYKDRLEDKNNINERCLQSFEYLDELLKEHLNNQDKIDLEGVDKILQKNEYVQLKLGESLVNQYRKRIKQGTFGIQAIKKIEKVLSNYCEAEIFGEWKKTISYKTLKEQFINNGQINEKLSLFAIPVS